MPTLREHTREALAANEPSSTEAAAELRNILEKSRARARRRNLGFVLVPALAAACVGAYFAFGKREPVHPATQTLSERGVHLYLRAAGEPEERATTLDLTTQGDL